MKESKKKDRDPSAPRERDPNAPSSGYYEPVKSTKTGLANGGLERDTIRDLRPPFMLEREFEPLAPPDDAVSFEPPTPPKTTQTPSGQLFRPGECFKGRYQIVSVLNSGSLARVYHAKQLPSERDVTLKVLLTRYAGRPEIRHAMHQVGAELSRVQHPGIVTIHDTGNDEEGVWIVTEFLDGETSRTELKKKKRFSLERTVSLILESAAAVATAHAHGIIHGDLKPENIFIKNDHVKIVDFLTVRILTLGDSDNMRDEFAYATAEYAAPECFDQNSEPDERSDIYSLALVFLEFVTGVNPMLPDGKPAADALLRLRQRDFAPLIPAKIPAPLAQVLRRALEKKPGKRQRTMLEFATELERAWKHALTRADEAQPTWLDRWWPSLPPIGVGSLTGVSFGLLAFVLFEAHKAAGHSRSLVDMHVEPPTAVLSSNATSPQPPARASTQRIQPSPTPPPARVNAASPTVVSSSTLSVAAPPRPISPVQQAPQTPSTIILRSAAPQPRPNPPPARPTEASPSRPLEISDKPPF